MSISSIDVVYFTFAFIVPGYIIDEVIGSITPVKHEKTEIRFLKCLLYSVINYVIWAGWGIKLLNNLFNEKEILYWLILAAAVIVSGVITGIAIGIIKAKRVFAKILNPLLLKMNLALNHPAPSAWDFKFDELQRGSGVWVIVRLKDGSVFFGRYGNNSLASSDESARDIYLEAIYTLNERKDWTKVDRTDGIWINSSEISTVEFKE